MSTQDSRSRRDFLFKLTSAVGGGVAIAASSGVVQAKSPPPSSDVEAKPAPTQKGYQHTEHVETYYRLADF
jgi:Rieske Fe-S protein